MRALALGALLLASSPSPGRACATAPPPGLEVQITDEEAIIAWDAASKTEHFVRRASFRGAPRDFGFLVPTPSKPELAEATEELFERFAGATQPPVVYKQHFSGVELTSLCFLTLARSTKDAAPAGVQVLARARVGGYDAAVLEARDPGALASWLAKNGYDDRPSLRSWLAPYVDAGWKITAFKIAPSDGGPVTTSPVRLTFPTERPFFPYREPPDSGESGGKSRLLRVYFLSDQRHEGQIGDGARPWPGQTELARPLDPGWLAQQPGGADLGSPRYLTLFEDRSSPRPGVDELYFSPSKAGDKPRAPLVVSRPWKFPVLIEALLLAVVAGVVIGRWRARRLINKPPP